MDDKLLNQDIQRLNISCKDIQTLKSNQIYTLKQLCSKSKTDLTKFNLSDKKIEDINLELHILGLNLHNIY